MTLSQEDVAKVALLARLQLSSDELDAMTSQLQQIIAYVEQLDELDTENVVPLAHAADLHDVFAEDRPEPSLPRELALREAPKKDEQCYRVPAVMGD